MKITRKILQTLSPRDCEERRALRVAIAKSRREAERLRRDVERNPQSLACIAGAKS